MNKRIDFTYNGGFPATQFMTNFMQESYRACFMAIAALIGDKVIVQGCDVVGSQVTNGWISVAGELIPFTGGVIPADAQVVISEAKASRVFDDNATHDVYFTKTATIGSPGQFAFSDLKRVSLYKDLFQSFTNLVNAFNIHTHSWNDITDRPALYISHRGSVNIGDINPTDTAFSLTIPHQGTADYYVAASWVGNDTNWNMNNDLLPPLIYGKIPNGFSVGCREVASIVQNVRMEYIIIKSL